MHISPIEIFCGTGGVGKTTLAVSRAFYAAHEANKRVLLMTLDPSKRLKDLLHLSAERSGELEKVSPKLDAILVNPFKTFERIFSHEIEDRPGKRILEILFRPYGGMNELMALVELQEYFARKEYDLIVLDTPPGGHFVDFLMAAQKFKIFFHQSFMEVFDYLSKNHFKLKGQDVEAKASFVTKILATGIKKLLDYLDKVTGGEFLREFVDAISMVYGARETFFKTIDFQKMLQGEGITQWILVSSVEQDKLGEAMELKGSVERFLHHGQILILNKSLQSYWEQWSVSRGDECDKALEALREMMLEREKGILEKAEGHFQEILKFPEILTVSLEEHVFQLQKFWGTYAFDHSTK